MSIEEFDGFTGNAGWTELRMFEKFMSIPLTQNGPTTSNSTLNLTWSKDANSKKEETLRPTGSSERDETEESIVGPTGKMEKVGDSKRYHCLL